MSTLVIAKVLLSHLGIMRTAAAAGLGFATLFLRCALCSELAFEL